MSASFSASNIAADEQRSVAVIILNYNGGEMVQRCVSSFLCVVNEDHRIVVVDNGSTDGSADRLTVRDAEIELLKTGRNLGYTGGNNFGLQFAIDSGAKYVLLVNHDTVLYNPAFIDELVEFAEHHPRAGIIGPRVHFQEAGQIQNTICGVPGMIPSAKSWLLKHFRKSQTRSGDEVVEAPVLNGVCVLLRVAMLRETGLFDEAIFMYREDADLALRARAAGWSSVYVPADSVIHLQDSEGYDYLGMVNFLLKRNAVHVLRKNGRMLEAVGMAVSVVTLSVIRAVAASVRRSDVRANWRFTALLLQSVNAALRGRTRSAAFGPPNRSWREMTAG